MKAIITVFGVLGSILLFVFLSFVSAFNYGNRAEQEIIAAWENNENILAQYGQKIKEAAQIPGMQRDDIVAIFTGANQTRYGTKGSQADWQWIQEQNPSIDSSVYGKIQQLIEAGRDEFKVAQTRLVDSKRSYRTELGSFFRGRVMLAFAGYPKINIGFPHGTTDDFEAITTAIAGEAFETGVESPIQLR